jgi:outer membrane lipoprotein carrier protein
MTHRKFALFIFIFCSLMPGISNALDIWQKYSKLKTLTSDFNQTKELKSIGVTLKSKGSLSFDRPNSFVWKVTEPKNFVFTYKDNAISIMEDGKVLKNADSANFDKKMLEAITHLKAWMMIDQKFIEEHYNIKKLSDVLYEFTPKQDVKMFKNIVIELGNNYPIKKISLMEVTNDMIVIEFSKTKMTYEN